MLRIEITSRYLPEVSWDFVRHLFGHAPDRRRLGFRRTRGVGKDVPLSGTGDVNCGNSKAPDPFEAGAFG
jgi:hypothetical protein